MAHKLTARSKIANLPDDLRSVADAMLREKFPEAHREQVDAAFKYGFTSSSAAGSTLTMESLQKAVDMLKRNDVENRKLEMMYGIDMGFREEVSRVIIMKPRNYGKSQFWNGTI